MQKNNNILFITKDFGGILKRVILLNKLNRNIHILIFGAYKNREEISGITFHYAPLNSKEKSLWAKAKITWKRARHIRGIVKNHKFDTVVSFLKEASVPTVVSKMIGSPAKTVVAIRNNPHAKFDNLNGLLSAFLYRFADLVVTNSTRAEQICKQNYKIKNTATIYNPVDYDKLEKESQEHLPKKYEEVFKTYPVFINVGRLSSQKGHWHLIRAFSQVVKDKPKARLVILGEGGLRPKLEKLISDCNLQDSVFLLGNQENVFPFLRASNYFVFSSLHEGLPNAVLEAKAIGLPIISTDCETGPREILAPELLVDEKLEYPYSTDRHTLLQPLSGRESFKSVQNEPLETAEEMLAKVMKRYIKRKIQKTDLIYDERFMPDEIYKQWLQVF